MKNASENTKPALALAAAIVITMTTAANADVTETESTATSTSLTKRAETVGRPMFFVNTMVSGALFHEDGDNRLTSLESQELATAGLLLRAGGVVQQQHLIGVVADMSWRSSRKILDGAGGDDEWGSVTTLYVGPEYRYVTDLGIYFGASAGVATLFADNSTTSEEAPGCSSFYCAEAHLQNTDDRGAVGFGVRGTLGYEHRFHKYFAVNVEAFAGAMFGEDEYGQSMNNATYGLAVGVGI